MIKPLFIALALSLYLGAYAQVIVERSIIGSSGLVSPTLGYTMGEAITATETVSSIVLTQGFQQPDADTVVGISNLQGPGISIVLYPNPCTHVANIELSSPSANSEYSIHIYNMLGQQSLSTILLPAHATAIDVSQLSAGLYFARVQNGAETLATIKFQKID